MKGVSARKVDDLIQAMGMTGISKSQVSRLCMELDERVATFLSREVEGRWPYLWLDATYVKSRELGRVTTRAVVVAVGVNGEGRREVLGLSVGPAETEAFWTEFLRDPGRRGLQDVKLVVSDAHEGLKRATAKVLGSTWQRCRVHFMRSVLADVPRKQHPSTNTLERLNKEIKRRSRVVGMFPSDGSILRLVGALLAEQTETWQVGRRYMSLEAIGLCYAATSSVPCLQNG